MDKLEEIIMDYIENLNERFNIIGAMITGSYITGTMGPNSDIDIFFLGDKEDESMRGREFYKDIEFEYFISPEWKYYDRLKSDLTSQQIYSTGKIVLDLNNIFKNIQEEAIKCVENYCSNLTLENKKDYSFYIETLLKDGIDMLEAGKIENFYFISGMHLPNFCNIISKLRNKYPVYEKYAIEQLRILDEILYFHVMELYKVKDKKDLLNRWISLCKYILKELGEINIKNYQVISKLKRVEEN